MIILVNTTPQEARKMEENALPSEFVFVEKNSEEEDDLEEEIGDRPSDLEVINQVEMNGLPVTQSQPLQTPSDNKKRRKVKMIHLN